MRLTSIVHILSPETDNWPSWIRRRERMTVENNSWSISMKECCRPRRGLNPRPLGLQLDGASKWATKAGIATADMKMLCNIFPILSSQLMKRSSFKQFLLFKKNGHESQWSMIIWANSQSHFNNRINLEFGGNWLSGFWRIMILYMAGKYNKHKQDGSHLRYPIRTILATVDLQSIYHLGLPIWTIWAILIYKSPQCFLPNFESTGISVQEKKRKIDFQDGRHLGFSDRNDFSYFWSTSYPDASYQFSSQLALWFIFFFFFWLGFNGPFKNISLISSQWAKTGVPGEKPPDHP